MATEAMLIHHAVAVIAQGF